MLIRGLHTLAHGSAEPLWRRAQQHHQALKRFSSKNISNRSAGGTADSLIRRFSEWRIAWVATTRPGNESNELCIRNWATNLTNLAGLVKYDW